MDSTLLKRGRVARSQAQERAGGARINSAAWFPSLQWLKDLGYKQYEIAEAVQLDESRVREVFRWASTDGSSVVHIDKAPVDLTTLSPEIKDMLNFTGEGFRLFYEWASDYDSLPEHCEQWVQEFCDERNLMLNVPPRHMKSEIFSVWLPIWLLCRNRDEQIILVSKTDTLAIQWAATIAYHLEFNERLVKTFGRFAPERKGESVWQPGKGRLLILGRQRERRGVKMSILARGSGQQILGMEATVAIIDDPTDAGVAKSEVQRERELEWLREQVLSRIENPLRGGAAGRAVIIGQRVHFNDLYGSIGAQVFERGPRVGEPLWKTITHRAVLRWPDEDPERPDPLVLWPEQWPFDELMVQYERVGGHKAFETMFQQNPLPDDARLVLPEWWEKCRDYKRGAGVGLRETGSSPLDGYLPISRVISLDPSPRRYNGLVVADVLYDRQHFACAIIECDSFVGSLRDISDRILEKVTRYKPDYFILEKSTVTGWAEGDPFFNDIRRMTKLIAHSTGRNKSDPELGLESLARDIEFGSILLPYGDIVGQEMSKKFEEEVNIWPHGPHDDVMMAVWFIKNNYRKLMPNRAFSGHFTGKAPQAWGYLRGGQGTQALVDRFRRQRDAQNGPE